MQAQVIPKKPFRHKTLEERAAEYGNKLLLDGEYDWGEGQGFFNESESGEVIGCPVFSEGRNLSSGPSK